jgi:DNA polymerase V
VSKNNVFEDICIPRQDPPASHLPQMLSLVPAGFPSPADDYLDTSLDLNEHLVTNRAASFYVRVAGDSMTGAGIMSGDILLVDRSLEPVHNRIVVGIVDNEMVVKRLCLTSSRVSLVSENPLYRPIDITRDMDCYIWGVVTAVIRKLV